MVIIFILPASLIVCAIIFWIKDWYEHSLKEPEDQKYFLEFIFKGALFLPVALQAIFLIGYALAESLFLNYSLSNFIESNIFDDMGRAFAVLNPLKIIYSGSLLATIQFVLLKRTLFERKGLQIVCKAIVFFGSVFLLKLLVTN